MLNVVLVEPKGEENIGAVSRAMMNMNVSNLLIVNPRCDHLSERAVNYSVHSKELLNNAVIYNNLEEALSNSGLSIAITRRTGGSRKKDFSPVDMTEYTAAYKGRNIHIVFGREENGLTNEEIDMCDLICTIPSSEIFPSINLSHAVMIILYELSGIKDGKSGIIPAGRNEFGSMLDSIYGAFEAMSFFNPNEEKVLKRYIKRILLRAGLEEFDVNYIRKIFENMKGILNKKTR